MKTLRKLFFRFFPCYRRLELRVVTYTEADALLRASESLPESQQWQLAIPEEDHNHVIGVVYLERKERITQ